MVILVLVIAVGVVAVGVGSLVLGSGRKFDDVERFHIARTITTGWARNAVSTPVRPSSDRTDERESVDA